MNISEKPHRLKHCETTSIIIILCNNYHLVMTNSLPWKIQPFLRTVNHLFLWAMFHGYVTNNQRVLTYVDGSKPCTPGEHQNSWEMDVHPTKNVSIGIDPSPYDTSLYGYGSRTALPIWMGGWTARALVKSLCARLHCGLCRSGRCLALQKHGDKWSSKRADWMNLPSGNLT